MADFNDSDDLSQFEKPPRHQEDVNAEIERLSIVLVDLLMENEDVQQYAELAPKAFAEQMGETIAMILGNRARLCFAMLRRGYESGIQELEDMDVEQFDED